MSLNVCWRHSEAIVSIHLPHRPTLLPLSSLSVSEQVCTTSVTTDFFLLVLYKSKVKKSLKNNKLLCFSDVNDCASQPCKNGGMCRDLDGDYTCQCPTPYVGKQCQLRMFTFSDIYMFTFLSMYCIHYYKRPVLSDILSQY